MSPITIYCLAVGGLVALDVVLTAIDYRRRGHGDWFTLALLAPFVHAWKGWEGIAAVYARWLGIARYGRPAAKTSAYRIARLEYDLGIIDRDEFRAAVFGSQRKLNAEKGRQG